MRILILEDHPKINSLLKTLCEQEGYTSQSAFTLQEAILMWDFSPFDVVLVDLMLPDGNGEEFIRHARATSQCYIIVITAKTEVTSKLSALTLGADDYLTKPFSLDEVAIKLSNLLKRNRLSTPNKISFNMGKLVILPEERKVLIDGNPIEFTPNEFDILHYLYTHNHRVVSRIELFQSLLTESNAYDRIIDTYIKVIRQKLHDSKIEPRFIKTHYKLGYQFIGVTDEKF